MTSVSKPDRYRADAEECWKFANDAEDIETKAVFQLTAEAWTMLAAQVETLEALRAPKPTPLLLSYNPPHRRLAGFFSSIQLFTRPERQVLYCFMTRFESPVRYRNETRS